MDKSLEFLKSMSKEELNTLRRTIESILFPEPIPVSIDHEASDVRKGKSAQEFPHCVTPFVGTEPTIIIGGTYA